MIKSSLLYWFPLIQSLDIPYPRTEFIFVNRKELLKVLDYDTPWPEGFEETAKYAANIIGYPLFLRTDLASGKHNWMRTCFVTEEANLMRHIFAVLEFNEIADIVGLPYEALVFREFIPLKSTFRAFNGLPIAKERRYFVKDNQVLCHHPYWIEDAISQGKPQSSVWRRLLAKLNKEYGAEITLLTSYSETIAKIFDGYWSVDYAKAQNGWWYLIDMAESKKSWHPECEYGNR